MINLLVQAVTALMPYIYGVAQCYFSGNEGFVFVFTAATWLAKVVVVQIISQWFARDRKCHDCKKKL